MLCFPRLLPKKAEAARPSAAPSPQAGPGIERRIPTVSATPAPSTAATAPVAPAVAEPQLFRISPRAAKLAKESVIDPTPIVGTGPSGRIVERDVKAYLEARGYGRLRITPTAKQLAAREGIDLLGLEPKEDGSQITVADIERLLAERPKPLTRMRQIIAQRLTESYTHAPHFFVTVSVDVTELESLRAELKAAGTPYTLTDFIVKAAALALEQFPTVNSTSDGKSIRLRSKIHLGLAVALEQGLVVPVIRQANELTLAEIHARAQELTAKARAGQLTPAEMTGQHVYDFQFGHDGRGELYRDYQSRRERHSCRLERRQTAGGEKRSSRDPLDDEDDPVQRSPPDRRSAGGAFRELDSKNS